MSREVTRRAIEDLVKGVAGLKVVAALLALVCLTAVACSESALPPGPSPVSSGSVGSGTDGAPTSPAPQASWSTVVDAQLPLSDYVDYFAGPPVDEAQTTARREAYDRREGLIASCMKLVGFDYTPREYVSAVGQEESIEPFSSLPIPLLSANRFEVVAYGYGTLTSVDVDLGSDYGDDPNAAYAETLSGAAALEFNRALYGDPYSQDPADIGCAAKALDESPPPEATPAQELFEAQFGELVMAARTSVGVGLTEDERVVDLDDEWHACMLEAGFDAGPLPTSHGPILGLDMAIRTRADGSVAPQRPDTPTADIPVEERTLLGTEAERGVAVADYDCRASLDYVSRMMAVRISRDNEFIDGNRDALGQLVTAASS